MPQISKVSRNNTTIVRHEDGSLKRVTLHNTVVFEQGPARSDGSRIVAISNGGWNTVTTQTRINQCFRESRLPMYYSRTNGGSVTINTTTNGEGGFRKTLPMPPHGRCVILERAAHYAGGGWKQCADAFVVVN